LIAPTATPSTSGTWVDCRKRNPHQVSVTGQTRFHGRRARNFNHALANNLYPGAPTPADKYHEVFLGDNATLPFFTSGGSTGYSYLLAFVYSDITLPPTLFDTVGGVAYLDSSPFGIDRSTDGSLLYPVPLPPALPMFGTALLALAGFAVRKSRKRC
jgi:hypothetical protein